MAKTYRRWDGKQYQNYLDPLRPAPEKKPFKDFSRGMKMKLAIAVALSPRAPGCWCWTRPPPAWTPSSGTRCWRLFNEFTREEDHSILISSHILSATWRSCATISPSSTRGGCCSATRRIGLLEEYGIFVGTADQAEQPSGRGRGSPGEQQLRRRPVPGEAGAGACRAGRWSGPQWRISSCFW